MLIYNNYSNHLALKSLYNDKTIIKKIYKYDINIMGENTNLSVELAIHYRPTHMWLPRVVPFIEVPVLHLTKPPFSKHWCSTRAIEKCITLVNHLMAPCII